MEGEREKRRERCRDKETQKEQEPTPPYNSTTAGFAVEVKFPNSNTVGILQNLKKAKDYRFTNSLI